MKSLLVVLVLAIAVSAAPNSIFWRNAQGRIAGGQQAKPGQLPHQVGIFIHLNPIFQSFCGGSLISPQYVLTAAHCADSAQSFTIVLGAININDAKEPGQVRIEANEKVVHPEWNIKTIKNDIALIKLPKPVQLNDRIQLVRLPKKSQASTTFANFEGTISGWGTTGDSSITISPVLLFTKNKILTNELCSKQFSEVGDDTVHASNICISGAGGKSACGGDSGGPMTVVDKDNKLTQVGLTSFGPDIGCEKGYPAAYTRLTSYLDWIAKNSDVKLEN